MTTTTDVDQLWYTRCPVPTASGLAHRLGWLSEEFARDGLGLGILQDAAPEIARHHFDHALVGLIREGGSVPAIIARSEGSATRVIGLTWIEESQAILVRPEAGIHDASGLRGARVAVPEWAATRAKSFPRAMALHGFAGALRSVGLGLDDVQQVDVTGLADVSVGRGGATDAAWPGLPELQAGLVDAVYVKGARSVGEARRIGARVAVDLDALPDASLRVNNGTPRPITVHEELLRNRPDVVTRFLVRSLHAAQWAREHPGQVREVIASETRSEPSDVEHAYGDSLHLALTPGLAAERVALLGRQVRSLAEQGFLQEDVDVDRWVAAEPLEQALEIVGGAS